MKANQTLGRRQRIWDDLEAEIREEYGWGKSLRWLKECVDGKQGGSIGLRTLNQRMHELAALVPQWQEEELEDVPPVVRVDGLWVTLMFDTKDPDRAISTKTSGCRRAPLHLGIA